MLSAIKLSDLTCGSSSECFESTRRFTAVLISRTDTRAPTAKGSRFLPHVPTRAPYLICDFSRNYVLLVLVQLAAHALYDPQAHRTHTDGKAREEHALAVAPRLVWTLQKPSGPKLCPYRRKLPCKPLNGCFVNGVKPSVNLSCGIEQDGARTI